MYKITINGQSTFVLCRSIRDTLKFLGICRWPVSVDEVDSLLALDAGETLKTLNLMRGSDSLLVVPITLDEVKDMLV